MDFSKKFAAFICGVMALSACAPDRVPFEQDARDTQPSIKIYLIELPTDGDTPTVYEETNVSQTLFLTPGKKLRLFVRADGVNGVIQLSVETKIDGVMTASAIVNDKVDSNGYVAAWLRILGTDGAVGPGDLPIGIELLKGQTATVIARAVAPQNQASEINVELTTDCRCPFGTLYDRYCNCGCLSTGPAPVQEMTDVPLLSMCGVTCCRLGEQCQQPGQICGPPLNPRSRCDDGSVCTNPYFPVCRLGWCSVI